MSSAPSAQRVPVASCPLCGGQTFVPAGLSAGHPVVRCTGCELHLLNPQPSDAELVEIYHPNYSFFGDEQAAGATVSRCKQATAAHYLGQLAKAGISGGRLLEVGCGDGDFLVQAAKVQFSVEGIDYSPHSVRKTQAKLPPGTPVHCGEISVLADHAAVYDLCVACDVIEHVRQPAVFLNTVGRLLKPGGWVFLVTPDFASLTKRLMGSHWLEYKAEHLYYDTPTTLRRQLTQAGFTDIRLWVGTKMLSLDYVTHHFTTYPVPVVTPVLKALRALLPASWSRRPWLIPAGGMVALARKPAA